MTRLWGFVRRDALVAASYRTSMVLSLVSLITLVVPMYFIADAVQPIVGDAISTEGGEYFAFAVAGMATFQLVMSAVGGLPGSLASGLRNGTFEALLTTPTRLAVLLVGFVGYPVIWSAVRAFAMVLAGQVLGAGFALERFPIVLAIWVLIALSYLPFGVFAGAMLLVTRTTGPIPALVLTGSMLLGGVYYPTHVIPSWLEYLSSVVPLTYGLRALRRILAEDMSLAAVAGDLGMLALLTAVLLALSYLAFTSALAYARRTGTLAQY